MIFIYKTAKIVPVWTTLDLKLFSKYLRFFVHQTLTEHAFSTRVSKVEF